MSTAYVIVTVVTIVANVCVAVADLAGAKSVRANAAEVRVPTSWVPALGALKAAGAAGLVLGLVGVRPLGIAAAAGLVLFFAGALTAHVRARVLHNIAVPGTFFALAVASLVLALATGPAS
ncbi:DoxX family protein [Streptomyces sp. NPDC054863]